MYSGYEDNCGGILLPRCGTVGCVQSDAFQSWARGPGIFSNVVIRGTRSRSRSRSRIIYYNTSYRKVYTLQASPAGAPVVSRQLRHFPGQHTLQCYMYHSHMMLSCHIACHLMVASVSWYSRNPPASGPAATKYLAHAQGNADLLFIILLNE